jgi:hypothetical protein
MQRTLRSKLFCSVLFGLSGVVACGGPGSEGESEHACQLENHCIRDDGEVFCEDGYHWQDSSDPDNYICEPVGGAGPGPSAGGTVTWSVPPGGHVYGGFGEPHSYGGQNGNAVWTTFDLTGDGIPDLVSTGLRQDAAGSTRSVVHGYPNEPHWLVHAGGSGGFSSTASRWPVPTGGHIYGGFHATADVASSVGSNGWALLDVDGDGRADLVVTSLAQDQSGTTRAVALGYPDQSHWLVFRNTGSAFADTGSRFLLPTGGHPYAGFNALAGGQGIDGAGVWSVMDMNGDKRPDLVLSGLVKDQGGTRVSTVLDYPNDSHWMVYLNSGSGFGG